MNNSKNDTKIISSIMSLQSLLDNALNTSEDYDKIFADELETLQERVKEQVQKKEILKQYEIKQFNSGENMGKFYCIIDGKKIQSVSLESLQEKIVKKHEGKFPSTSRTLKAVYNAAQEDKLMRVKDKTKIVSAQNTKAVHDRTYRRFIEGHKLENMQINHVTDEVINLFLDEVVYENEVKAKAFKNLIAILNQTFRYAQKKRLIKYNPMNSVFIEDYEDSFTPSAPINKRAFTSEQLYMMREEALKMQKEHPEDSRWWSYEFTLLTGERRAEIPPIRWSDVYINDDVKYIDIHQQLIGKMPYYIKPSSKTGIDRFFPIGEMLEDFLKRLKENNEIYHPDSEFLFPDEKQELGCITPYVTYRAHAKICKTLDIPIIKDIPKGTHSFRRNHQSSFIEEGGSIELAGSVYGNHSRAIENNYLLKINSKAAASIVDKTHEKLFKSRV